MCPDFTGLALGLDNCFTAFIVLGVGIGFGITIFAIEALMKCSNLKMSVCDAYDRDDDEDNHEREIEELEERLLLLKIRKKLT